MIRDLQKQIDYCRGVSPLYGDIFQTFLTFSLAHESGEGDPQLVPFFKALDAVRAKRVFVSWIEVPLLLAGALHHLALIGKSPAMAGYYATCGGGYEAKERDALARTIRQTLIDFPDEITSFVRDNYVQTNETGRGLGWLLPLLSRWRGPGQDIILVELGCSAGLGLIADHYGYDLAVPDGRWRAEGSPHFCHKIEAIDAGYPRALLDKMPLLRGAITHRIGCDHNPLDCRKTADKDLLEALIWGDNAPRLERLRAAIKTQIPFWQNGSISQVRGDIAAAVPALAADAAALAQEGALIFFFNTIASCYLDNAHYARLKAAIEQAFSGPLGDFECLWVEMEMPRDNEALPDFAQDHEVLLRRHECAARGVLETRYFGATQAHPHTFWLFDG